MARARIRQTLIFAISVAVAALVLFFWGCPYLVIRGHQRFCIALYAVLLLIYIFGRGLIARSRPRGPSRPAP